MSQDDRLPKSKDWANIPDDSTPPPERAPLPEALSLDDLASRPLPDKGAADGLLTILRDALIEAEESLHGEVRSAEEAAENAAGMLGAARETAMEFGHLLQGTHRLIREEVRDAPKVKDALTVLQARYDEVVEGLGMARFEPAVGEELAPGLHRVLEQDPSSELPPRTICRVIRAGYRTQDRILQPALVVISSGTAAVEDPS